MFYILQKKSIFYNFKGVIYNCIQLFKQYDNLSLANQSHETVHVIFNY